MAIPISYTPTANTVALWHLEDVNDSSGLGHNLTNVNTVAFNAGIIGNCADFGNANTNKYLYINDNLGLDTNNAGSFTIVLHAYRQGTADQQFFCYFPITGKPSLDFLYIQASKTINLQIWNGTVPVGVHIHQELVVNEWHCLMLQKSTNNFIVGYDGNVVGSEAYTIADGNNGVTTMFTLGSQYTGAGTYWQGKIDEVIIENIVWTSTKFYNYYNNITGGSQAVWFFMKKTKTLWNSIDGIYRPRDLGVTTI
jgi:hypothetical protein